jgi:hypothetical protein
VQRSNGGCVAIVAPARSRKACGAGKPRFVARFATMHGESISLSKNA